MHARMTTMQIDPARIDEVVANLEENDVPMFREIKGFKRFTLVIDRKSGKLVATSYWTTAEAMAASEEQVRGSRDRAAQTGGASDGPQVETFEVALDSST